MASMAPIGFRDAPRYGSPPAAVKALSCIAVFLLLFCVSPARAEPLRLLALGDSLTAGYGLPQGQGFVPQLQAELRRQGLEVRVLDGGVSGDTTAGGLARLDWMLADNPQAAIVALGGNDGLRGLEPRQSEANLAAILDKLAARNIPVLLAGMLAPPNLGADYGREFAAVYQRLGQRPGVTLYPFFLDGVAADAALNQADGIHPNARGVGIMVSRIAPAVVALLQRVPR